MDVERDAVPTVSICLPVFNGENYLAESVESMLAQTFTDFELIISDNASTDRTEEISRGFVESDPRVRYHRNSSNVGGARNQAVAMELARGEFIHLAAHDDKLAPTHLEECLAALAARPDAVIAFSATVVINDVGGPVLEYRSTRGTAATPSERFRELIFRDHNCDSVYGVIRAEVVHGVRPLENFIDADKVWLCRMAFLGPFVSIDRPLFYKRFHAKNHVTNWRDRMAWYNPHEKGKVALPNWIELRSFTQAVSKAPIPTRERVRCAGTTGLWVLRYSPKLAKDVVVAVGAKLPRRKQREAIYNWE
jgi:glycosyltransferase involved in cell wall biosynthesis